MQTAFACGLPFGRQAAPVRGKKEAPAALFAVRRTGSGKAEPETPD